VNTRAPSSICPKNKQKDNGFPWAFRRSGAGWTPRPDCSEQENGADAGSHQAKQRKFPRAGATSVDTPGSKGGIKRPRREQSDAEECEQEASQSGRGLSPSVGSCSQI